jgi:hypothetical protein
VSLTAPATASAKAAQRPRRRTPPA